MDDDVFLKSIILKTWSAEKECAISSVQCILSNGVVSPPFESLTYEHFKEKRIEFSKERPVGVIRAFATAESDPPQRV